MCVIGILFFTNDIFPEFLEKLFSKTGRHTPKQFFARDTGRVYEHFWRFKFGNFELEVPEIDDFYSRKYGSLKFNR